MPKSRDNRLQREADAAAAEQREQNRKIAQAEKRAAESDKINVPVNANNDSDDSNAAALDNESSVADDAAENTHRADSNDANVNDDTTNHQESDSSDNDKEQKKKKARAKKNRNGIDKKNKKNKKQHEQRSGKTAETKAREKQQAAERLAERKERWKNRKRLKEKWHDYRQEVAEKHAAPDWKPFSAKVFDKFIPALPDEPYTLEQNKQHAVIVRIFTVIIVGVLCFCGWRIYDFYAYKTSGELLIPATTYTPAQKAVVKKEIEKQGFKVTKQTKKGTYAHGTPSMVEAYKKSYKKKILDPAIDKLNDVKEHSSVKNLNSIYVSNDYKSISINTDLNVAISTELNKLLTDSADVERAINTVASWNIMNGTDKTHISFWCLKVDKNANINTDDSDDNSNSDDYDDEDVENAAKNVNSKEFYSCDATSCSDVISKLESKEHKEAKKEANKNKNKNSNKNSNKSKKTKKNSNTGSNKKNETTNISND